MGTAGESQYSPETIANTSMVQSELEEFRESLNLPAMELKIDSMSTKHATQTTSLKRKIENFHDTCSATTRTLQTQTRTLQTLANEIDLRTTAIEKKPRFAAFIRPADYLGEDSGKDDFYLPTGDITNFSETIDV